MSTCEKQLLERWTAGWTRPKDPQLVVECFHPDFVIDDGHFGQLQGIDGVNSFVDTIQSGLDIKGIEINDSVQAGNVLATRITVYGKHIGRFLDLDASQRDIVMPVMCWWEFKDGQFHRLWQHWDPVGLIRQMSPNQYATAGDLNLVDDIGSAPDPRQVSQNEQAENRSTVRSWMLGAWNHHRLGLADFLFAEDFWFWDPFGPVVNNREEFKVWAQAIDTAFPNRSLTVDHLISEGDRIAYRVTLNADHDGQFLEHKATGKPVSASAMVLSIHENGQYKKAWQIFDVSKVLQQIAST